MFPRSTRNTQPRLHRSTKVSVTQRAAIFLFLGGENKQQLCKIHQLKLPSSGIKCNTSVLNLDSKYNINKTTEKQNQPSKLLVTDRRGGCPAACWAPCGCSGTQGKPVCGHIGTAQSLWLSPMAGNTKPHERHVERDTHLPVVVHVTQLVGKSLHVIRLQTTHFRWCCSETLPEQTAWLTL